MYFKFQLFDKSFILLISKGKYKQFLDYFLINNKHIQNHIFKLTEVSFKNINRPNSIKDISNEIKFVKFIIYLSYSCSLTLSSFFHRLIKYLKFYKFK